MEISPFAISPFAISPFVIRHLPFRHSSFAICHSPFVIRHFAICHLSFPHAATLPILEFDPTPEALIEPKQVIRPRYRETPATIQQRKAEGCSTVEMEAAGFFAVAQFRGAPFAHILYGGDDVSGEVWTDRDWHARATVRERLFWLAVEACLSL